MIIKIKKYTIHKERNNRMSLVEILSAAMRALVAMMVPKQGPLLISK
jgi:hypothetical protein